MDPLFKEALIEAFEELKYLHVRTKEVLIQLDAWRKTGPEIHPDFPRLFSSHEKSTKEEAACADQGFVQLFDEIIRKLKAA
jgi:hypothetical protein